VVFAFLAIPAPIFFPRSTIEITQATGQPFEPDELLRLAARLRHVSLFAAPTMVKRLVDPASASMTPCSASRQ